MRIVEINGIKLEVDERTARTIESYKVGDKVKVLVKSYGDTYNIYPGVIVGFSDFKALPSIEIVYFDRQSWSEGAFKFACLNAQSKDMEIAPFNALEVELDKQTVLNTFDSMIQEKEAELAEFKVKRAYFVERFAKAFETIAAPPLTSSNG